MRLLSLLFVTCILLMLAAVGIAGPHRMMAPNWFGMLEIAPNIFAPESMPRTARVEAIALAEDGETAVEAFFGWPSSRPIIVLCPKDSCDAFFGQSGVAGIAYGRRVIRLNESGINSEIMRHELAHTALKERIGEVNAALGAVPAWFDEGLAVLISGDKRYMGAPEEAALADLRAEPYWNLWGQHVQTHGHVAAYTAAHAMVRQIEDEIGRDGVIALINRVGAGEDFHAAWSAERALR